MLFTFSRRVEVDPQRRLISITSRHLWLAPRVRRVNFDEVVRIVYRAQMMPDLGALSWLGLVSGAARGSAAFFIGVVLRDGCELNLFRGWERQPQGTDALAEWLGAPPEEVRVGDEEGAKIVSALRAYLRVPIAPS